VTHDQTEALSMSDRIAVMSEGSFVEIGSPDELYYHPHAAFTARLIGGANVFKGTARAGGDGMTFVDTELGVLVSTDQASGPVEVFVRPDRIAPAAEGDVNAIDCDVRERRFAGETTELDLVHRGRSLVLRSRMPTSNAKRVGATVRVKIDPADVRMFRCD